MAPFKRHPWSCFSRPIPTITLIKAVKILSKVKYNGNTSPYNHFLQFILSCNNFNIHEDNICRIFTLTLTEKAKDWFLSLPVASVHRWNEFS